MAQRKEFSNSLILDKKKICEICGICVTKNLLRETILKFIAKQKFLSLQKNSLILKFLIKKKICENLWNLCDKRKEEIMKKQRIIELAVKVIVAALTAFLTALGTTSCMGRGPF